MIFQFLRCFRFVAVIVDQYRCGDVIGQGQDSNMSTAANKKRRSTGERPAQKAPHDGLMCACCNQAIANTDDHVIVLPCQHQLCTLCMIKSQTSRGCKEHSCPVASCNNTYSDGCRFMSHREERETLLDHTNPSNMTLDELDTHRSDIQQGLQSILDKLELQVVNDWHDGYDKQAETAGEWFLALQGPVQEVLDVGVGRKKHLKHCNDVLLTLVDSWDYLLDIGCRIKPYDMLSGYCDHLSFDINLPWSDIPMNVSTVTYGSSPHDLFAYIWNALLRTHASLRGTDERLLLQCIKDAHDNDGVDFKFNGPLCDPWEHPEENPPDNPFAPDGSALASIIKEKELEWKSL